jgi:hypothetical protein
MFLTEFRIFKIFCVVDEYFRYINYTLNYNVRNICFTFFVPLYKFKIFSLFCFNYLSARKKSPYFTFILHTYQQMKTASNINIVNKRNMQYCANKLLEGSLHTHYKPEYLGLISKVVVTVAKFLLIL